MVEEVKMKNQVLRIDQMQELMELGIDTSNASMHWISDRHDFKTKTWLNYYLGVGYDIEIPYPEGKYIPTFTFQDITDMLPKHINAGDATYFLSLLYDDSDGVVITYCTEHVESVLHSEGNSKQIDAAFNMLKWCKQNNYMK